MNIEQLKKNLHDVIERYNNRTEFCGEIRRDDMARDCLQAIEELEAKIPKWISTKDRLPDKDGEYQVVHKLIHRKARIVHTDLFSVRRQQWERAILPKAYTHWAELSPLPPATEEK